MMKAIHLLFLLLFCSLSLRGQPLRKSAKEHMEDAEYYFNNAKYEAATASLKQAVKQKPNFAAAQRLLGVVAKETGDYETARMAYERLFKQNPLLSRAAYFEAAELQMKAYNYIKALEYFELYKYADPKNYSIKEEGAARNYDAYLDRNIKSCEYAIEMEYTGSTGKAELLPGMANSKFDEFLPTLRANGDMLLYTSNRSGDEDILMLRKNDKGEWKSPKSIGPAINTPYNEGMAKFTVCGRRIFFAACAWENVQGGCDIYVAEYDSENEIVDSVGPAVGLNSEAWDSQPSISCDGYKMYFVSTREGGFGGSDIWVSDLMANGRWGVPENLGPKINTEGDEEAPFIAPDGQTLYFVSDGHPGLGEADAFRTLLLENGEWSRPVNMGEGVNSPFREAGIVVSPDGEYAYFSSDRPEGKGGLDLYSCHIPAAMAPAVEHVFLDGYLYDEASSEPLAGARVRLRNEGENIGIFETDKAGRFFLCLPSGASYSYIISKEGYDNFIGADYFERAAGEAIKRIDVQLSPNGKLPEEEPVMAEPPKPRLRKNLSVYFETGKYDLSELQKEQIQKLLEQFEDPENLKIQVTGFADDVGDKEFNLSLSQKRAGYVTKFMKELGITSAQITTDGRGVIESNMAKHQKRKVEIIILNR
ncbi:OmpA family protein [Saprospira grandis]|nr:OmpA family protein [Saprospira grandis]